MTEDILQNDELKELLRFRAIVAHDVKYADLASGCTWGMCHVVLRFALGLSPLQNSQLTR